MSKLEKYLWPGPISWKIVSMFINWYLSLSLRNTLFTVFLKLQQMRTFPDFLSTANIGLFQPLGEKQTSTTSLSSRRCISASNSPWNCCGNGCWRTFIVFPASVRIGTGCGNVPGHSVKTSWYLMSRSATKQIGVFKRSPSVRRLRLECRAAALS